MHDTAMKFGALFFKTYLDPNTPRLIVDVGAMDINGSLRAAAPATCPYIGVDTEPGKGVDLVVEDAYSLPFETATVDVVVSSSCLEHSEHFWIVFNEIQRILKPDGLFYLNVPSNGYYHRYPVDCWRFYPDSAHALTTWARKNGFKTALLESFIADREQDQWNDFIAVFVKDEQFANAYPNRMSSVTPHLTNASVRTAEGTLVTLKQQERPEDQRIQRALAAEIRQCRQQIAAYRNKVAELETQLATHNDQKNRQQAPS